MFLQFSSLKLERGFTSVFYRKYSIKSSKSYTLPIVYNDNSTLLWRKSVDMNVCPVSNSYLIFKHSTLISAQWIKKQK